MPEKKAKLENIAQEIINLCDITNNHEIKKIVDGAIKEYQIQKLNLLIIGRYNSGKSTFINALLGNNVMPTNVIPTNKAIAEICYGDTQKACYLENSTEISCTIDAFNNNCATYSEDEIVSRLYYPNEILKKGVVIVDTPGLEDPNFEHSKVTFDYVPKANMVFYFLDSTTGGISQADKDFIENNILKLDLQNKMWFVLNRIDNLNNVQLNEQLKYVKKVLIDIIKTEPKVYAISAKKAMEGRIKFNKNLIAESGIENLEQNFKAYIETNNVKMVKTSFFNSLTHSLFLLNDFIENKVKQLKLSKDEISNIKNEVEEQIKKLTIKTDEDISCLKDEFENIERYFDSNFNLFIGKLECSIYDRINSLKLAELKDVNSLNQCIEKNIKNFIDEISPEIQEKLKIASDNLCERMKLNFQGINELIKIDIPEESLFKTNPELISISAFAGSWFFLGWMNFFVAALGIIFARKEFEKLVSGILGNSVAKNAKNDLKVEIGKAFEQIKSNFQQRSSAFFIDSFKKEKERVEKQFDELILPLRNKYSNPPVDLTDNQIKEEESKLYDLKNKINNITNVLNLD